MRKIFVMAAIGVIVSSGMALAGDTDVGCGWGTMAFKGQRGVAPKILAATTNSLLGNQTFGISSGTAGCNQGGTVTASARLSMYAAANIDKLASDMAAGQGESLDTLAYLMGIDEAVKPVFFQLTKSHFSQLFPSDAVTAGQMLTTLRGLLASEPQLAKYAA